MIPPVQAIHDLLHLVRRQGEKPKCLNIKHVDETATGNPFAWFELI